MGLFNAMLGNASAVDAERVQAELAPVLAAGESVQGAWQLVRDQLVFTDRRVLLVDRQGLTGSKRRYHSIPWRSITQWSLEGAGTFDLEAELQLWVSGQAAPVSRQLSRGVDLDAVHQLLARLALR